MPTFRIRAMLNSDITDGMALKERAGWNQTRADWSRTLALQPDGCFVAELGGQVVGTVATCRFGPVGWVAMMLVDEPRRGRGIGKALLRQALAMLDAAGAHSVRLDATPLGRPLYEALGFVTDAVILRYRGTPTTPDPADFTRREPLEHAWDDALLNLDAQATGADRRRFLLQLFQENPHNLRIARRDGAVVGYRLARPGSSASQIGPCVADARVGPSLLADALHQHRGTEVILDVPESHDSARSLAEAHGLTVSRQLTRMTRGPLVAERLDRIWASSGPEMG